METRISKRSIVKDKRISIKYIILIVLSFILLTIMILLSFPPEENQFINNQKISDLEVKDKNIIIENKHLIPKRNKNESERYLLQVSIDNDKVWVETKSESLFNMIQNKEEYTATIKDGLIKKIKGE
ncbi:hypothetical protein Bp8pS_013 [Bacillus phage vB_BpuM-BpSp]|nr:hypothetical protein Bp8pS_013 [Bacillus phage vB_BpuM-BpSp]